MKQNALILCDSEVDYVNQMSVFLSMDGLFPCEIITCTCKEELERLLREKEVQLLVMAEAFAEESMPVWPRDKTVILNESGLVRWADIKNIDKYREAELVRRELLQLISSLQIGAYPVLDKSKKAGCVAFYSPIRRCLQTSMAIAYSQLLADHERVLYLNFEYYSTLQANEMWENEADLTTLLYYADCGDSEFEQKLRAMRRCLGNWDYIMPIKNGENLVNAEADDWLRLVEKCRCLQEYDTIVLDISDAMQGVYGLLKQCDRVYTIVKSDRLGQEKMKIYEHALEQKGYASVKEKTMKLLLPNFARLPEKLEDYSRGELAEYVQQHLLAEEVYGVYELEG